MIKQLQTKKITENELVLELNKLGYKNANKRLIARYRNEALLPDFDLIGSGLGKGLGRSESGWTNSAQIIERAEWIFKLRALGIGYENLHLNLWMIGYDIHPEDVRDTLLEPLELQIKLLERESQKLRQRFESDERTKGILEDVISDEANEALHSMSDNPFEPLAFPQDLLEVIANVFFNPEFGLTASAIDDISIGLRDWRNALENFESEFFEDESIKPKNSLERIKVIVDFFNNANFFQKNFSLHRVQKAVSECSYQEFAEVQTDLKIIRKILSLFYKSLEVLMPQIQLYLDSSLNIDSFLPTLFGFGEYIVLADIAIRRSGNPETINRIRSQIVEKIEKDFSKTMVKSFEQSAPDIGEGIEQISEIFTKKLNNYIEKHEC